MSIDACHNTTQSGTTFSAWGPTEESAQGKFVLLLYRLGWYVLFQPSSTERLKQLHGYLDLGLSARIVDAEVRCVRIFGSLSSSDEWALRSLFASIPQGEPLVVDMTNFDGMGTLLYPAFTEFARCHDRLAWVGSANAVWQLREIGVNEQAILGSTEEAAAFVREGISE